MEQTLSEFLSVKLKLTLSTEKTFITHANDEKAKFLGHELTVSRSETCISRRIRYGKVEKVRATNGKIALLMPAAVARRYHKMYSKEGTIIARPELLADTEYTIIQRYQSVLRGIYNFYCMTTNVSRRMRRIKWILQTSLTKTLASKLRVSVTQIYKKYRVVLLERKMLRVVVPRPNHPQKTPLVAIFGGISFERKPEGMTGVDHTHAQLWFAPGGRRSEVVQRLLAGKCELCGRDNVPLTAHHIRKLADINRPGRRPKAEWERIMAARKRKTLMVCEDCHYNRIHAGQYNGHKL